RDVDDVLGVERGIGFRRQQPVGRSCRPAAHNLLQAQHGRVFGVLESAGYLHSGRHVDVDGVPVAGGVTRVTGDVAEGPAGGNVFPHGVVAGRDLAAGLLFAVLQRERPVVVPASGGELELLRRTLRVGDLLD